MAGQKTKLDHLYGVIFGEQHRFDLADVGGVDEDVELVKEKLILSAIAHKK